MSEATSEQSYKRARVFAKILRWSLILLVVGFILATFTVLAPDSPGATINLIGMVTVGISFLALIVSTVATTSAVLLGWRADRRRSEEFKLKIEQLELQLAEARRNASGAPQISN